MNVDPLRTSEILSNLFIAWTMGFLGSVHCVGMCGGIAMLFGKNSQGEKATLIALMVNLGRLSCYSLLGLMMGTTGFFMSVQLGSSVAWCLRFAAVVFVFFLGLHFLGITNFLQWFERRGLGLWQKVMPWTRQLLPITTNYKAFLLGFIWGLLPCGLIYSALIWAISLQQPITSALVMLFFGLGTLPAMLLTGHYANTLNTIRHHPIILNGIALTLLLYSLWSAWGLLGHTCQQFGLAICHI